MPTIVGLAGSTRRGSYNAALLRAAAALAPEECRVEIASIADFPLYNGDLEAEQGVPPSVATLKDRIAVADGLLLVTPEYNRSMPGVFKNAIDWLTRPAADIGRVFGDRPTALMGASPGAMGTRMAQAAWLPVLRALGVRIWFGGELYVGQARNAFDAAGELSDQKMKERLQAFMAGFAEFIARRS